MNLRPLYLPDIAVHRRLRIIKNLLAVALLVSFVVTWKLWASDRNLAHVPLFSAFPALPLIAEQILFGTSILFCVLIFLSRKPTYFILGLFLCITTLALADINRLQPWLFEFAVMLLILFFYNWRVDEPRDYTPVFNSLRICIALFYIWDAVHKLNSSFIFDTWPWLLSSFENLISYKAVLFMSKAAFVIPVLQILAAVSLFFTTLKRLAIPVLIVIHLSMLVLIIAKAYNPSVWTWHIFMLFMLYAAFAGRAQSKYSRLAFTLEYKPFYAMLVLSVIVPLLNITSRVNTRQLTDFTVAPSAKVQMELSAKAAAKLPAEISYFTTSKNKRYFLNLQLWAMYELNSPLNMSPFVYEALETQLKAITCCPDDVNLRFKENSAEIASL